MFVEIKALLGLCSMLYNIRQKIKFLCLCLWLCLWPELPIERRMPRLIWVFAGRTCNFVGFVMLQVFTFLWKIYTCNKKWTDYHVWRVKRICVFEHSVMTNFNCACPTIQRGQGSSFLSEGPLDSLLVWASSGGSGETARMRRLAWTFAARIGDKYQIRLTRPM